MEPTVDTSKGEHFSTKQVIADEALEKEIFAWSMAQSKTEVERLNALGVQPIEVSVLDMSVLVQGSKLQLNRVVLNCEVDFKSVERIMISPLTALPQKPGFQYANVLLFGKGKPETTPIIFPYVFKTRLRGAKQGKNSLKHWLLVNNKCEEAYHQIKAFATV